MTKELTGIDISSWQANIDWDKAASNVDFVILRLGYGKNNVDQYARRNIQELNRLGIPYGVYWFSYAYTVEMARNEAKYAVQRLKEFSAQLCYPVYFDWEYDSRSYAEKNGVKPTKALVRQIAEAFCEEIRAQGYYPGIYTNPDYINTYYGEEIFEKYDLWLAQYTSKASRDARMWQYSCAGNVSGINGHVDMNRCYFDYPAVILPPEEKTPEMYFMVQASFVNGEDAERIKALLAEHGCNATVVEVKPT